MTQIFPPGFLWGAATAAYQIEGATAELGRTPSIWDTFSRTPGRTFGGDTGDVACDHVHRFREDVALMAELGLKSYRFSVGWPRVQPGGSGGLNAAGMDFYRRLVDELLSVGIEPWVTLYHWDLPQELEDAGGWPVRDTAYRFAEYAGLVHGALGDRVPHWTTLNEPWCSAFLGYASGAHAPGRTHAPDALAAVHHLLLGHGLAAQAIGGAGITLNLYAVSPADPSSPGDVEAVRRIDGLANRLFLDPLLKGSYPADVVADLAGVTDFSFVRPGDMSIISRPIEMLGVNYYSRHVVAGPIETVDVAGSVGSVDVAGSAVGSVGSVDVTGSVGTVDVDSGGSMSSGSIDVDAVDGGAVDGGAVDVDAVDVGLSDAGAAAVATTWPGSHDVRFVRRPGWPVTQMDWEIDAPGLTETLVRIARDYPPVPVYITENGAAYPDVVAEDGSVHDPQRVAFFDAHLRACLDAIDQGVPLAGYFAWSLLDNFEWAWGYSRRFGLVHVDYASQRRTVKSSGRAFFEAVKRNGLH